VLAENGKASQLSPDQTDVRRLEGRWVRLDGGYVLDLREIRKTAALTAAYFNPRPIKVFSAKWSREDGKINLFVELRDVKLPGIKIQLAIRTESRPVEGDLLPGG